MNHLFFEVMIYDLLLDLKYLGYSPVLLYCTTCSCNSNTNNMHLAYYWVVNDILDIEKKFILAHCGDFKDFIHFSYVIELYSKHEN